MQSKNKVFLLAKYLIVGNLENSLYHVILIVAVQVWTHG